MTERPFAVFDIDGTLIRWQLFHALADELANAGHIDVKAYQPVREARMGWKNRTKHDSFHAYERTMIDLIDAAISNITLDAFSQACELVIAEYKDQVYTYTRDLMKDLRSAGYLLFAISASQEQIVRLIANHYGFDDCGGTCYEIKNGRFTGDKTVLKRDKKPELLRRRVTRHGAVWKRSLGVGDSESDIPMLETIERPIAFNPNRGLFDHARQNGWEIVLERKNVIYQLESRDGSYLLA